MKDHDDLIEKTADLLGDCTDPEEMREILRQAFNQATSNYRLSNVQPFVSSDDRQLRITGTKPDGTSTIMPVTKYPSPGDSIDYGGLSIYIESLAEGGNQQRSAR